MKANSKWFQQIHFFIIFVLVIFHNRLIYSEVCSKENSIFFPYVARILETFRSRPFYIIILNVSSLKEKNQRDGQ